MPSQAVFLDIEPWLYQSPDVARTGRKADVGLLAEALAFYDQVFVGFHNPDQFCALIRWFQAARATSELAALVADRTITPYYYAFHTLPAEKDSVWSLWNVQDEEARDNAVFTKRILESQLLRETVPSDSMRKTLVAAAQANHREIKAADFGETLTEARADYMQPDRHAYLVQLLYDELFREMKLPAPPHIEVTTEERDGLVTLHFNRNFNEFRERLGERLTCHNGTPLAAAGFGVRTIWSAAQLDVDLFVGSPIADYAAFKLEEGNRAAKAHAIVDRLEAEADFPDIRRLVNRGRLDARDILLLRARSERFRSWLQRESEFDRNAVRAYLGELSKGSGWSGGAGSVIRAIGLVGGAAIGAAVEPSLGPMGGALAAGLTQYIADLAARLDLGWKPVLFAKQIQSRANAEPD
jgi:hypothetical protein